MESRLSATFVGTLKKHLGEDVTIFLPAHRVRGRLMQIDANGLATLMAHDDSINLALRFLSSGFGFSEDRVTLVDATEAVGIGLNPPKPEPVYRWTKAADDPQVITLHSRHPLATNNEIEMVISRDDEHTPPSELALLIAKVPGVCGIGNVERYSIDVRVAAVARYADVQRDVEAVAVEWAHDRAEDIGEGTVRSDAKPESDLSSALQDSTDPVAAGSR